MSGGSSWKPYLMTPILVAMLGACVVLSASTRYPSPAYGAVIFGVLAIVGGGYFFIEGFRKPVSPEFRVRVGVYYIFLGALCFTGLLAYAARDWIVAGGSGAAILLQLFQIYGTKRSEET